MVRNESELGRVQLVAVIRWKVVGCSRSFGHLHNLMLAFLSLSAPYSKPNLNLEPNKDLKPGDLAAVTCHASRGYPEASVLWQDSQGTNITENITTSQVANEEGLFDVHSVLQVLVEPSSTYSCLVRNPVLQQETHASVTITGEAAWTKFVKGRDGISSEEGGRGGTKLPQGFVHHIPALPLPMDLQDGPRLCSPSL